MNLLASLKAARRAGTPLVAIRTADPAGTMKMVLEGNFVHPNGIKNGLAPLLTWDIVNGLQALDRDDDKSQCGAAALKLCIGDADPSNTVNPVEALCMVRKLPEGGICFFLNAHRIMDQLGPSQALWNLRDRFKKSAQMLILLCPSITLPAELQQDVLILDEPLPVDSDLKQIALTLYEGVQLPAPNADTLEKIVDATLGLAAFPAEGAMAMSLTRQGMDIDELWSRKRSAINQAPGLSVWMGGEKFKDIGGCENVKSFLSAVISGIDAPRGVIWIDEIEKAIGTGQDTSGVSQGMLGQLLTWMEDNTATGCIFIGPPGAAKSAVAKATGNEAGIPTIALDLGGMKASLVGESESRLRNALKVIDAVTQKRALFLATCNSIAVLPPELRRRFKFGTFYFGLPTRAERKLIWDLYIKKYKLGATQEIPSDIGWTGAEIRQNCELGYRLKRSLIDCASFIVPVSRSAGEQIDKLCRDADGKFVSASEPGLYKYVKEEAAPVSASPSRRVQFADVN